VLKPHVHTFSRVHAIIGDLFVYMCQCSHMYTTSGLEMYLRFPTLLRIRVKLAAPKAISKLNAPVLFGCKWEVGKIDLKHTRSL